MWSSTDIVIGRTLLTPGPFDPHISAPMGGGVRRGWLSVLVWVFGVRVVLVLGADGAAEDVEALWDGLVVDPSASFLALDEACVAEYFQVVADGGL